MKKIILISIAFILAACSKQRTEENYKSTDTMVTPMPPASTPAGPAPIATPDTSKKMPGDTGKKY